MSERSMAKKRHKFGFWDKLAYGAGDFGCNMSFGLKGTLIIFWTQYMGLDTLLYAALYAIVQIWDAINDPLLGGMIDADRRQYKLGKFRTYILIGSIGLLFAGALCFLPVPEAPAIIKNILFASSVLPYENLVVYI